MNLQHLWWPSLAIFATGFVISVVQYLGGTLSQLSHNMWTQYSVGLMFSPSHRSAGVLGAISHFSLQYVTQRHVLLLFFFSLMLLLDCFPKCSPSRGIIYFGGSLKHDVFTYLMLPLTRGTTSRCNFWNQHRLMYGWMKVCWLCVDWSLGRTNLFPKLDCMKQAVDLQVTWLYLDVWSRHHIYVLISEWQPELFVGWVLCSLQSSFDPSLPQFPGQLG